MKKPVEKKVGLLLVLAVLSLIVLSACASGAVVPADSTATVPGAKDSVMVPATTPGTAKINDAKSSDVVNIATGGVNGTQVVSDEVKTLLANQDKLNSIVAKGDLAGCKELDMAQFETSCETNILANKAASNKDLAVCDAASSVDIKIRCQEVVSAKVL